MQEPTRRTNAQRSEETRTALITAARKLFVAKGFAETGTPEIVKTAEGAHHYFDAMARPGRARLLLIEGPAALGPQTMAEINKRTGMQELRAGLAALSKTCTPFPVDAMAEALSAAFDAAALRIAEGGDSGDYLHAIERLLTGLKAS